MAKFFLRDALDASLHEVDGEPPFDLSGMVPDGDYVVFRASDPAPGVLSLGAAAPTAARGLADQDFVVGVAVSLDVSTDFTGSSITYSLAPSSSALPAGLTLSTAGLITGTPTAPAAANTILVRGANPSGFADSAFSVAVQAAPAGPPHGAVEFWDFSDPTTINGGAPVDQSTVLSVVGKVGGYDLTPRVDGEPGSEVYHGPKYHAPMAGATYPGARIRFNTGATLERLDIPAQFFADHPTLTSRSCSVFCVTRQDWGAWSKKNAALFSMTRTDGFSMLGLMKNNSQNLEFWANNSGNVSTVGNSTGATCSWVIGDASAASCGSDFNVHDFGGEVSLGSPQVGFIGQFNAGIAHWSYRGDMQAVVVFDRALSPNERDDVLTWMAQTYGTPPPNRNLELIFDGDSITAGVINQAPQYGPPHWNDHAWSKQLQRLYGADAPITHNTGDPGARIRDRTNASRVLTRLATSPASNRRIVFALWGFNDINGARTATQIAADYETYMATIRAAYPDVEIGIGTLIPTSAWGAGYQAERTAFNDMVRKTTGSMSHDFFIDTATTPELQDPNDATYYDQTGGAIHLTAAGNAAVAPVVKAGIDALS